MAGADARLSQKGELESLQRARGRGDAGAHAAGSWPSAGEADRPSSPLVLVLEDYTGVTPPPWTCWRCWRAAGTSAPARPCTYRPPEVRPRLIRCAPSSRTASGTGYAGSCRLTALREEPCARTWPTRFSGVIGVDALARLVHQRTEGQPPFTHALSQADMRALALGALVHQAASASTPDNPGKRVPSNVPNGLPRANAVNGSSLHNPWQLQFLDDGAQRMSLALTSGGR